MNKFWLGLGTGWLLFHSKKEKPALPKMSKKQAVNRIHDIDEILNEYDPKEVERIRRHFKL